MALVVELAEKKVVVMVVRLAEEKVVAMVVKLVAVRASLKDVELAAAWALRWASVFVQRWSAAESTSQWAVAMGATWGEPWGESTVEEKAGETVVSMVHVLLSAQH